MVVWMISESDDWQIPFRPRNVDVRTRLFDPGRDIATAKGRQNNKFDC
jgi:hypothetical protein